MNSRILAILGFATIAVAANAQDVIPNLGQAGLYTLFGVGNSTMGLSSGQTVVNGNVALGSNGNLNFSGGGVINGTLSTDGTSQINLSGNSTITGGQITANLNQASQDAINASLVADADKPTQTFQNIDNSVNSLTATGPLSVFQVNQNVQFSGGHVLTINGAANDFVLINVLGNFQTSGGSSIDLTGGLTANHVLWNFEGNGGGVQFSGKSTEDGTFLAIGRDINDSGGVLNGALIGAQNHSLTLQSGPHINGQPVPEPFTAFVLAPGLLFLRKRRNRQ